MDLSPTQMWELLSPSVELGWVRRRSPPLGKVSSRQRALAPNQAYGRDARLVADAHEIVDRPYPHLLHHPPTMHLDRLFRSSEIGRDLLVQAARDHMFED